MCVPSSAAKNISISLYLDFFEENQIILNENYLQHHVVCIQGQVFSVCFVSKDDMSLYAQCQIFVDRARGLDNRFLVALGLMFTLSSYL
jgi:hypothetical protein